jgi:hypothetical protein
MNKIIPTTTALALALALPAAALAQNHGNGQGHGQGQDQGRGHGAQDKGGGAQAKGRGGEAHGRGQDHRDPPAARQAARGPESRGGGHDLDRAEVRVHRPVPRVERRGDREVPADVTGARSIAVFRVEPDRGLIAGCPPGLAKRNNGCLPPGQARKMAARARYDYLWNLRPDAGRYRYDEGYLYRVDQSGSVLGWLPVLGGALAPGAVWPQQYAYQPVPAYYTDYFGLNRPYDYRYANGALYGVDPRTQAITQVAALLTGQPITVGQPLPAGYDVYNVPYPYRSQYADTPDGLYRYSDGYVYRVDPTTQLVQAAIQLLT